MSAEQTRVVVTGFGAVTPLGDDAASTWSAMLAGKSGVRRLTDDWPEPLSAGSAQVPVSIAAVAATDPASAVGAVAARRMDRGAQFALIAARQAWQDAGTPAVPPDRLGVVVSSGVGGLGRLLSASDTLAAQGWQRLSPFTTPMIMTNGAAGWISIEFGAQAGAHAPVSACASSSEAIGYGVEMIRAGRADMVLAGGTEAPVLPLSVALFAQIRALSYRNDDPVRASRPFDADRDGFVLGEGAGVVVLESAEHAARRGAAVHAVAAGVGYSSDAYHLTQTDAEGTGPALAIRRALADASLPAEQVTHISAHATSTPVGDLSEARAIRRALGEAVGGAVVSATKSMTGHLLGGVGAVEAIAAMCALRDGVAPPTINLDRIDPEVEQTGIDIATEPRKLRRERGPAAVLSNSFGFGGHNVVLAFTTA